MIENEEFIPDYADLEKLWDDEIENAPIEGMSPENLESLVHELTARRLVEALRDPERSTPGMLQAALRFLKDNDITGLPIPGSAHAKLKEKLGGKLPFTPRLTGTE